MASARTFATGNKPKRKLPTMSKQTKQRIKTAAKTAMWGTGKVLRNVEAFTTGIGRAEEAAYKRRTAQQTKKRKPKSKHPRAQTLKEFMGY